VGSVRGNPSTGKLFIDFRYQGKRCREYTDLSDCATNRKRLGAFLGKIEREIKAGTFDYERQFPNSPRVRNPSEHSGEGLSQSPPTVAMAAAPAALQPTVVGVGALPTFNEFAEVWFRENEVAWRNSHRRTQRDIVDGHLKPAFKGRPVNQITKADVLNFRANLAQTPGRGGRMLSPKRINAIMAPLRQILTEASDRYEFNNPYRNIKSLKVPRSDVYPFSLEEVNTIIRKVRPDFRNYYLVRFFTGMRTGEIDGLKWKYVDFERRLILIRETIVDGEETYTKTDASQRDIEMSQVVYDALQAQAKATRKRSPYVFCNQRGEALDHNNVTKRVWYPLLRHLGFEKRRPYQTRHTAATLWLAAGENPEWIARQMGHTTTEMLFRVYSRFVPNLTRKDGSAFERLLASSLDLPGGTHAAG
jgi:integrase